MRLVIYALLFQFLFFAQSFAQTAKASSLSSEQVLKSFSAVLDEKGFVPLDRSAQDLSKMIQADQVWYDKTSKKHIVGLLADKIENWPRNEIKKMRAGFGYVYKHPSGQDIGLGFYDGFTEDEVEDVIVALKQGPTAAQTEALQANQNGSCNCSTKENTLMPLDLSSTDIFGPDSQKGLSGTPAELASQAFSCLKDVAQGVWNSTGGQVVDGINVIRDPKKAWDEAHKVFAGVREFVGEFEKNMKASLSNFALLDREMIGGILCSIIGEIGGPALTAMLTGGAGLANALNRVRMMSQKISQVSGLISVIGKVGTFAQHRDRFLELLKSFLNSKKELPAKIKEDVGTFSSLQMPDMALDSLECAL